MSREDSPTFQHPPNLLLPGARRRYGGLAVSLVLHAALLVFVLTYGHRLWQRTMEPGSRALFLANGGGGGGNGSSYITLPSPPKTSAPVMPKPAPPPVPPPPKVATPAVEPEVVAPVNPPVDTVATAPAPVSTADAAGTGTGTTTDGGTGGGAGGGTGTGAGEGSGPGTGPGAGGDGAVRPPELRDLAFPFDNPPKELRGASLNVTFWVRNDGRVDRYEVVPAIADRDYARKFDEVIRAFRFTPARLPDGTKVAGTTTVTFTLPGKRIS
jgi:TonB family protein